MKGIKTVLLALMCLNLIFLIQTGFAQTAKNEPVPAQDTKVVKVIKGCYIPYVDTKKLYAVVETSSGSSVEEAQDKGKIPRIGKEKPSANDQKHIVQQTYQFSIYPDVEVREKGKNGSRLDLNSVAGVGYIHKADIYIVNNEVVKIIILEMLQ